MEVIEEDERKAKLSMRGWRKEREERVSIRVPREKRMESWE